MTPKQWRMLEILERHPGEGHMEVLLAWGDYDFGDAPEQQNRGWNLCKLVVAGLVRSLVRKGFAADDEDGYGITEAGLAILARRRGGHESISSGSTENP